MKQCRSGIRVGNLGQDEKLCMYEEENYSTAF